MHSLCLTRDTLTNIGFKLNTRRMSQDIKTFRQTKPFTPMYLAISRKPATHAFQSTRL
ncbi:hypothetical protein BT96DRAFT_992785 [Gymnopus androsaceus JB14]|uniref:Uncharacterized protein n=1 Tax=Gymnopus androsaceus JB14 TaxID=1447944 RepID=A0A6A4HSB9_9AGAR|nr:hypothetical protein BT96DRAFT_992785 [Gymnopus androsaceus JB14]